MYNYPPRGDEETNVAGYPTRPGVAVQISTQALMTNLIAKVTAAGAPVDGAIRWAERELEGYLRA